MIDSHCHLDFEDFDNDRDDIIKSALDIGVFKIINPCSHFPSNFKVVELSKKYNNYFFSLGLHPEEASKLNGDELIEIEKMIANDKCVAIGEIGLDYHYVDSDQLSVVSDQFKERQKELFIAQLELAKKYDKPVIIHNRDSVEDIYNILKQYDLKGVIHCYSENVEWAKKFLEIGFNISFTGIITFKNVNPELLEVVKYVPIDRILIETDSPFLAPVPFRGKLNKPEYVKFVAERVAELKGISFEEVSRITDENCERLFFRK